MKSGANIIAGLFLILISTTAAEANLVVNGDFSIFVPTNDTGGGWTSSDSANSAGHRATNGNPGGYFWLNNVGGPTDPTISQTVTGLVSSTQYYLTGDYISVVLTPPSQDSFAVDLGGVTVFSAGPTPTRLGDPTHTWESFGVCFTASAPSVTLALRAEVGPNTDSDDDFGVDNISITEAPTCPPPSPAPLDHFTCYQTVGTQGSVRFDGVPGTPGLSLVDQFGTLTSGYGIGTSRSNRFCAPTNKLGEDPTARSHPEHLTWYPLTHAYHSTNGSRDVQIFNQFNATDGLFLTVKLKRASHILVPTAKDLNTPPPLPTSFVTDHFVCYRVARMRGKPKFQQQFVTLEDQFNDPLAFPMTADVTHPRYLCAPVNKNGEDPTAPSHAQHLVCYSMNQTGARFTEVSAIHTHNQFAEETFDVKRTWELCVPSTKILLP